jgi:hypothetical protein
MVCKEECRSYSSQVAMVLVSATLNSDGRADDTGGARSSSMKVEKPISFLTEKFCSYNF